MDVYSLLYIVKSYYRPDNYDLHKKLQVASKKYYEFTKDLNIDEYFDAKIEKGSHYIKYTVCELLHRLNGPAYIKYYTDDLIEYEEYYINNSRCRNDELINGVYRSRPSFIRYNWNKSIRFEIYFVDNKLHRIDGPAWIEYYSNGSKYIEKYYIKGKTRRNDFAYIEYYQDGSTKSKKCYVGTDPVDMGYNECNPISTNMLDKTRLHCTNGPAYIEYYSTGVIYTEEYRVNGKFHRTDGLVGTTSCSRPAHVIYYSNGSVKLEVYYINGKRHRIDGPARIEYYKNGSIKSERYCFDNGY